MSQAIITGIGQASEDVLDASEGSVSTLCRHLAWHLVETVLRETLDPNLEDTDNWFSHVEDDIINQLNVD